MELTKEQYSQIAAVEKVVSKARGKLGVADICAETGYAARDVDSLMNVLMERYRCRLKMNPADGRLQFNFEFPLRRRDEITFHERWNNFTNAVWKIFKAAYKVSFGVVMAVYSIVYVVILFALSVATNSSDDDDRQGGGELSRFLTMRLILEFVGYIAEVLFNREHKTRREYYVQDGKRCYREYREESPSFVKGVYQFVFGPDVPKYDPLNDSKEVIAFLRTTNGRLTAGDIVNLSGATLDEAESRLAEYAGKFGGELHVEPSGVVVGEFERILQKENAQLRGGKIEYYANEVEPAVSLTGNSSKTNAGACVLTGFNLLMSFIISCGGIDAYTGGYSGLIVVLLGYFPLLLSLLFFIIPLCRISSVSRRKAQRERNIVRKFLIEYIVSNSENGIKKSSIARIAEMNRIPANMLQSVLNKLVLELRGEVKLDPSGDAVYDFSVFKEELRR